MKRRIMCVVASKHARMTACALGGTLPGVLAVFVLASSVYYQLCMLMTVVVVVGAAWTLALGQRCVSAVMERWICVACPVPGWDAPAMYEAVRVGEPAFIGAVLACVALLLALIMAERAYVVRMDAVVAYFRADRLYIDAERLVTLGLQPDQVLQGCDLVDYHAMLRTVADTSPDKKRAVVAMLMGKSPK